MYAMFGDSCAVDMIVIDEAYNFRADLLDAIDIKLRKVRGVDKPFGGIQVVLLGDPLQNVPIVQSNEARRFGRRYKTPFIFSSKVWKKLNPRVCVLTRSYRNENIDQLSLLNSIRLKDEATYRNAVDEINKIVKHGPGTKDDMFLCSYLADAAKINNARYAEINSPERLYKAQYTGSFKQGDGVVDSELKLKVGALSLIHISEPTRPY